MNNQDEQLISYIKEQLLQGNPEENIRQTLLQYGWDSKLVDQAFAFIKAPNPHSENTQEAQLQPHETFRSNHRVRNGVLWILSPFIVLVGAAIINFLFRLAGINSPIINIVSILAGMAGVILVFVGPVLGIIKLTNHK
ncbi:MAG: hypothetical protein JWS12_443 [Candidatus Saccharibacteria bacterium]|nr:hypothetical protein [Candidatus Saccharibacteria bacterium]